MRLIKPYGFIFLTLILLLLRTSQALSHKMLGDALVNADGTVLIEAFFPDGSPVKNMQVEVFKPDGSLFIESKTDQKGQVIINPKGPKGIWKAVIIGKMGHRTEVEFEITPDSLGGAEGEKAKLGESQASGKLIREEDPCKSHQPKATRLAHKEETPWFQIIAGLAFILALTSLIMQLKSRQERKSGNASTRN